MQRIGSHVSMSGKEMLLGSAKEAFSYGANTFMFYTGAPQNTKRKEIAELNIDAAWNYMDKNGIGEIIVHAPYIINLANTVKKETYELAVEFLAKEIERTAACRSQVLVLHPGAHVGAGREAGIQQTIHGLNEVLSSGTPCYIALETMAGKGSEIGRSFEELAAIYDGVVHSEKQFDRLIGKDQIAVFHINDSKNPRGAAKDRHENLGKGTIGFETLYRIVHHPDFTDVPKILETPWIKDLSDPKRSYAPYREEIAKLKTEL